MREHREAAIGAILLFGITVAVGFVMSFPSTHGAVVGAFAAFVAVPIYLLVYYLGTYYGGDGDE